MCVACVWTGVLDGCYVIYMSYLFTEAEKQSRMAALLEKLHAKHNASRPWQETSKVVRQAMVRKKHPYPEGKRDKLHEFI